MSSILVTGGAGFIGCNLADRLARSGHEVLVFDALARPGVQANLDWLAAEHGEAIRPIIADVRDAGAVRDAMCGVAAVFHLAAQVAVTTSLVDPRADFEINATGTLNVLEAARAASTPVVFASTNKVYGDLADIDLELARDAWGPADPVLAQAGIGEDRRLDFHTPYGCSKGAADQYVLDYARSFGVPATVLRMSCIYGPHQLGTEDQGWVAHFIIRALEDAPVTVYGDGRQVRDVLDVGDAVDAYVAAWERIGDVAGRAFNLGGGPLNAISLRQLLGHVGELRGRPVEVTYDDWRAGDQKWFVADARAARDALGLAAPRPWREGVAALADWLAEARGLCVSASAALQVAL